jgi:hypothetical protein
MELDILCILCLHLIGSPSVPRNLQTPISDDLSVAVLVWDPPLNNGGVAISSYLISVNMSQQQYRTDSTTFTLNSTELLLVEVSAVNGCGLMSDSSSVIINMTGR